MDRLENSLDKNNSNSIWVKAFAFSLPGIGLALLQLPVSAVLAGVYAKNFGLTLTAIASVMLVAKIFDAVTDPIVGYYSDYWRARTGSRKYFMSVGAVLLLPCSYFLFVPGDTVSVGYFVFWYLAFYLALTLFYIPYLAWINEFTVDTKEKVLVFSMNSIFGQAGGALFYLIPLLPFFPSAEITPEILQLTVIVAAVVFLPSLLVSFKIVPDGISKEQSSFEKMEKEQTVFNKSIFVFRSILSNRPFIVFASASLFLGVGVGMWAGMFFIYVDAYLKLGEAFAEISLWGLVCGALAVPFWYRLTLLVGKRKAWLAGMTILVGGVFSTSLLSPESSGFYELFVLNMLMLFAMGSMGVISGPMLCDAIDYGRLKDHVERNAVYFSVFTLLTKIQIAIGGALGIGIAGWFGYDVMVFEQTPSGLLGLHIGVSWLPIVFVVIAMVFIVKMPLDERRMTIVRHRLAQREN